MIEMKNNKTLHYRSIVQLNYVFCGSDRKLWENAKSSNGTTARPSLARPGQHGAPQRFLKHYDWTICIFRQVGLLAINVPIKPGLTVYKLRLQSRQ